LWYERPLPRINRRAFWLASREDIVIRNILIAALAVTAAITGYMYYSLNADFKKQAGLLADARNQAAQDLQVVNDKLASAERERQIAEKDAKSASEKLGEEQGLRDKAEQALKTANSQLSEIQDTLAKAQQAARDAKDAQTKAEKERDAALLAAKEAQEPQGRDREPRSRR
jgi:hypothetical protein